MTKIGTHITASDTPNMSRVGPVVEKNTISIIQDITISGVKQLETELDTVIYATNDALVTLEDDFTLIAGASHVTLNHLNVASPHSLTLDGVSYVNYLQGTLGTLALTNTSGDFGQTTMAYSTLNAQVTTDWATYLTLHQVTLTGGLDVAQTAYVNASTLTGTLSFAAQFHSHQEQDTSVSYGTMPHATVNVMNSDLMAGEDGVVVRANHGDNGLQVMDDSTISGRIMMGGGNDSIAVIDSQITGTLHMGSGADQVLLFRDGTGVAKHTGLVHLGDGNDLFKGNASNSIVEGGAGSDTLFGGAGIDRLVYKSSDEAVWVRLDMQYASGGHANGDVFDGFENAFGSMHGDALFGSEGRNVLNGFHGDDYLKGGGGRDVLIGGRGADTFVFRAGDAGTTNMTRDLIRDFDTAEGDMIDLRGLADSFGGDTFSNTAGEAIQIGAQLLIDIDGDAQADMRIDVRGDALTADSFVF